ncbi:unnamed protein product [Ceutorhynchus assimilis]|uniref:Uncharacterized protein n=1 Tax=Ceutorhynchus assimilis TaxID=467358 RepID=A0A9N9MAE3_9CUCU|nr:unnamed protein product [Ceutorhynchus assimilis]
MNSSSLLAAIFFVCFALSQCPRSASGNANSPSWVLQKFFNRCSEKDQVIKCLKIQALKVADRALQVRSFNILDGLNIVSNERLKKSVNGEVFLNETKLEKLSNDDLDSLLGDRASRFMDSHRIELNIPTIVKEAGRSFSEEARKKKGGKGGGKGGYGALLAALAIKGSFLAVAYKGIAIMSGTAILIGKMALILSAILGLKKLVSQNHEKTTFEIIKSPKHTEEHIHSSAHEDDHFDHYRRNYYDTNEVQKRIYRFQIPEH